jgi:hypothetical protein
MKNRMIAGLAFILTFTILTGCNNNGISQTKYDSAVAEKDNIQRQITEVKNQLIAAQNKIYQLETSGGSSSAQTGPTDLFQVSWRPLTYIDKIYGFKVTYPKTWKTTTRGTANIPVEIQFNSADLVPGSWVGIVTDTADTKYTQSSLVDLVSIWQNYSFISSGDTVLADNKTPAAYVEFNATVDSKLKHIYAVGYVDGDHWVYFSVWTIESVTPWEGNLMRQIAHTLNKATASEIATGTPTPTTTTKTAAATTATATAATTASALTTYTDATYKFSVSYNSLWTVWDPSTDTTGHRIFGAASAQWICPGVRIDKLPASTAPTLFQLIPFVLGAQTDPAKSSDEEITNDSGIKATAHVIKYTSPTDGYRLDAKIYGFIKNGEWWTMVVYQSDGLGTLQAQNPDKIFNSWKFN